MKISALIKSSFVALACLTFSAVALAQWQWMGKDGRKVFSDRPPPPEIQDKDILKRPTGSVRAVATPSPEAGKPMLSASAPSPKASGPKLSGKDAELEAKKKKADDEETAKKKAEADKVAASKAENCTRAKSGLATLQSGVRIASVDAKGERVVMDDSARALETKRTQEVISSSCN